jgi:hypothetical protein
MHFYAFDKRLHIDVLKSRFTLKNLNIDLKKFLETKTLQRKNSKNKKRSIIGKNSKIRYDKYILLTDNYDIEVKANGDIKAVGSLGGDRVKFSKKGKEFSIEALRIKDKLLHPLIHFKGLKGGRYSLKKSGNPDKVMKGEIIIEGGVIKGFKAYNNTLAFINTLPALATLHHPGFSKKGYKIKKGVIKYRMIKNDIIFDSINIEGGSSTIVGKGKINLKNKKIKMDLAIRTARELGSFIGSIPLLGYIIMGKDKSMTIGLKIRGTLENPKVKTSAAKEILTLPLQILKRTLESPAHIINK